MKITSATFVCPECNQQVSEYAMKCPNCGYSFDLKHPIKTGQKQHKKIHKVKKAPTLIFGITISAFVSLINLFVLQQSFLAYNIYTGCSTYNGLILFRNVIELGELKQIVMPVIMCAILLSASIVSTIICVVKLLRKKDL